MGGTLWEGSSWEVQWGNLVEEEHGTWVGMFLRSLQSRHTGPDMFRGRALLSAPWRQRIILERRPDAEW